MKSLRVNLDEYETDISENVIVKTRFSRVIKIHKKGDDPSTYYAAKTYNFQIPENANLEEDNPNLRELQIMSKINNNPTIVKLKGYSHNDFNKDGYFTIIMEYVKNGTFFDYIYSSPGNPIPDQYNNNTTLQIILIGIAYGMMILHKNNIMHRDLKPSNILLDEFYRPKICDFNASKKIPNNILSEHTKNRDSTCIYEAPEKINGDPYTNKIDVYSFGILLNEAITKKEPYQSNSVYEIYKDVLKGERPKTDSVPISFKRLIERCWNAQADERPTFTEIYQKLAFNKKDNIMDNSNYYLDNVDVIKVFEYIQSIDKNLDANLCIGLLLPSLKNAELSNKKLLKDNKIKTNEKNEASAEKFTLSQSNDILKTQNKTLSEEITKLNEQIIKLKDDVDVLKKENMQMKETIKELNKDDDVLKKENMQMKETIKELNKDDDTLPSKIEDKFSKSQNNLFKNIKPGINDKAFSKSQSNIASLKEIDKNMDSLLISTINNYSGEEQFEFFSKLHKYGISPSKLLKINTFLKDIHKRISTSNDDFPNFIKIQTEDENATISILKTNNDILNSIFISSATSKYLYEEQIMEDFYKRYFSKFKDVTFEFDYCTKNCNEVFNSILSIRKELKKQIKIAVYFSQTVESIENDDMKKNIDIVIMGVGHSTSERFCSFSDFENPFDVSFDDFVEDFDCGIFKNCKSLRKIIFPSSLTEIPDEVLKNCKGLIEVKLPNNLKEIKREAFMNCSSLERIDIPKSVKIIGEAAFNGCKCLKQIELPEDLNKINRSLFKNCSSLEQIEIPLSVTNIEDDAFSGCSSIKKITLHIHIVKIGHDSLNCINLEELIVRNHKLNIKDSGYPVKAKVIEG